MTVQDASDGDTATLPETLIMAAEQVELVQPDGPGGEEVVADKGCHSDATLVGSARWGFGVTALKQNQSAKSLAPRLMRERAMRGSRKPRAEGRLHCRMVTAIVLAEP